MFQAIRAGFLARLHPDPHGGVPGHEAIDAAWDAQADLEKAIVDGGSPVLLTLDYKKYFDSFDRRFMASFLNQF